MTPTSLSTKSDIDLLVEFMAYLDKVEVSDNDVEFHPNRISSCRALDTQAMSAILTEAKRRVSNTDDQPLGSGHRG